MEVKSIADINQYVGSAVNPLRTPDTLYELYSVPSYDNQYPEIIKGSDIGSTKVTVEEGDVLICKINPRINRVWVVKHNTEYPLLASSEWIVIRNKSLDSNYLKWYFTSPNFRELLVSQVAGIGGSLTRAQPKQVAKYPVPIPNTKNQLHIATILDKLSNLISLRKQQLAKLDELVKARFVEMFGDPVGNPLNWETACLSSLGNCKNGMNFHTEDSGIEIHCLGVGDFHDLSVISDISQLTKVSLNEMPSDDYLLKDEDIIFVRSNGNKALVGRSVAVYPHDIPTTFSGFCIRFRKNTDLILTDYLLQVLKTSSIREKITGRGANIQNLNQQILSELRIPVPPLNLQHDFSRFFTQTTKQKLTIQQGLDKLEVLKKTLMQEYFG